MFCSNTENTDSEYFLNKDNIDSEYSLVKITRLSSIVSQPIKVVVHIDIVVVVLFIVVVVFGFVVVVSVINFVVDPRNLTGAGAKSFLCQTQLLLCQVELSQTWK